MVKIVLFNVKKVLQFMLTYKVLGSKKDQLVLQNNRPDILQKDYCTPLECVASLKTIVTVCEDNRHNVGLWHQMMESLKMRNALIGLSLRLIVVLCCN